VKLTRGGLKSPSRFQNLTLHVKRAGSAGSGGSATGRTRRPKEVRIEGRPKARGFPGGKQKITKSSKKKNLQNRQREKKKTMYGKERVKKNSLREPWRVSQEGKGRPLAGTSGQGAKSTTTDAAFEPHPSLLGHWRVTRRRKGVAAEARM